jgi:hypothetical protein
MVENSAADGGDDEKAQSRATINQFPDIARMPECYIETSVNRGSAL